MHATLTHASAHVTPQVQLTWDETDHERVAAMSRKFNRDDLLDMDFRAYLASSSEEEPEEESRGEESRRSAVAVETASSQRRFLSAGEESTEKRSEEQMCKYRELLRGIQEKERTLQEDRDMDMEVTWVPGRSSPGPQPRPSLTA